MIQGFAHQVHTFTSSQNKINLRNNELATKNNFNEILDNRSKNERPNDKNNKISNNDLAKSQNALVNSRRVDVKNEETNKDSKKETTDKHVEVMSKEDKTIEELVENLNNLLLVFENVIAIDTVDLENIDLEDLNLEISIEELENLMSSLENLIQIVDHEESEEQIENMIKNISQMIEDVTTKGEIEIPAEAFIVELEEVMTLVSAQTDQTNNENLSKEIENSSEKIEELINVIGNPKETEDNKQVKESTKVIQNKALVKQGTDVDTETLENIEFKITIVTEKKEGINLFNRFGSIKDLDIDLMEDINPKVEDMPSNILVNPHNQSTAEDTSKITNSSIINPEQYMNIDKTDVLRQITNRVKTDHESQLNEIKIKLSPEHLGELTIKISLERGILSARALVENTNVKQMLENNIDELKKSLKDQGMEFGSIDVSVGKDPDFEEKSPNFFAQDKRVNRLKTKVDNLENPVDTNYYEDLDDNKSSSLLGVGETSMDITI